MKLSMGAFMAVIVLAWIFNIRGLVMAPQTAAQQASVDAEFSDGLSDFSKDVESIKRDIGEFSSIRSALSDMQQAAGSSTLPAASDVVQAGTSTGALK
jgi:hypothetical protein